MAPQTAAFAVHASSQTSSSSSSLSIDTNSSEKDLYTSASSNSGDETEMTETDCTNIVQVRLLSWLYLTYCSLVYLDLPSSRGKVRVTDNLCSSGEGEYSL